MNFALFVLWAAAGWCGNEPRIFPRPPHPDPEPWWRSVVIGVGAGILGGLGFSEVFGPDPNPWTGPAAAATAVGAFLASRVIGGVYDLARNRATPQTQ